MPGWRHGGACLPAWQLSRPGPLLPLRLQQLSRPTDQLLPHMLRACDGSNCHAPCHLDAWTPALLLLHAGLPARWLHPASAGVPPANCSHDGLEVVVAHVEPHVRLACRAQRCTRHSVATPKSIACRESWPAHLACARVHGLRPTNAPCSLLRQPPF